MAFLFSCSFCQGADVNEVPREVSIIMNRGSSESSFTDVIVPIAPEARQEESSESAMQEPKGYECVNATASISPLWLSTQLCPSNIPALYMQGQEPKVAKRIDEQLDERSHGSATEDVQGSNPFESLGETANLEELTSEGTCTVVLHPGDLLEYDPAEYFISRKDFQVKYECTINRGSTLHAKKSKSLFSLGPMRHSDKKAKENESVQKVLATGGLQTQAGMECDLEKGQGPLPTLFRSQGTMSEKVKRTITIDWENVLAAYTYGYLKKYLSESQLTQCMLNSYGHLDDDMDKAVFINYKVPGYPEAWLCLLVDDNAEQPGERDIFVKSLNAHAESAKKKAAEQAALEKKEADKKKLERAKAEASARIVTSSSSAQSVSSNPNLAIAVG